MPGEFAEFRTVLDHLVAPMPCQIRSSMMETGGSGLPLHEAICRRLRAVERQADGQVKMHAAAARLPSGSGLLAVGRTGAGKSTLAAIIARDLGGAVLADDTVELRGHRAYGIGAPIVLKASSPVWPDARRLWYGRDEDRMAVRPEDLGGSTVLSIVVDFVLHPSFGDELSIRSMSAAESFASVLAMLLKPAAEEDLFAVAAHLATVPSYAVGYRSVEECRHVLELVASSARAVVPTTAPRRLSELELSGSPDGCWGIRFGDDAVLLQRGRREVALLSDWPSESVMTFDAWSQLVASAS